MTPSNRRAPLATRLTAVVAIGLLVGFVAACQGTPAGLTSSIVPGGSAAPREVNLIARDYAFVPATLDLVPGETVLLHVINGGLVVHEAVIGDQAVQDAWEAAEAETVGAPPGPTPVVSVPPGVSGIRIVVASGERVDLVWTVPAGVAAPGAPEWLVGCHIPGHWTHGMQITVSWVEPDPSSAPSGP